MDILDATLVFVGKRRTGKSWAMRNIMYMLKDKFQGGVVISQTDELNKFWRQYVPRYTDPRPQPTRPDTRPPHTGEEKREISTMTPLAISFDLVAQGAVRLAGDGRRVRAEKVWCTQLNHLNRLV